MRAARPRWRGAASHERRGGRRRAAGHPLAVQADSSNANVEGRRSPLPILQNVGDVTLTGVSITDAQLGENPARPHGLAAGAERVGSAASYVVRERPRQPAGGRSNGKPAAAGGLAAVSAQPGTQCDQRPAGAYRAVGSIGEASVPSAEATIYTYTVTNAGNLSLEITLTDSRLGAIALDSTTLAPGASRPDVASLTPGQGDLPGPIVTQATASARPSTAAVALSAPDIDRPFACDQPGAAGTSRRRRRWPWKRRWITPIASPTQATSC